MVWAHHLNMKIIPTILTNDLSELLSLEKKAEGVVDRIQIDVIDHKFVESSTVDPSVLKDIKTNLNLDFHLMVKGPIDWIEHCIMGSQNRIIGQIEEMENQNEFVEKVIRMGSMSGLALNLPTLVEKLDQSVLSKVSVVLLLSVPAGFNGQEFDLNVWSKIDQLVRIRKELDLDFKICVDGGITQGLVNQMEKQSVDEVTVGKRIFEPDLKTNLALFNGKI